MKKERNKKHYPINSLVTKIINPEIHLVLNVLNYGIISYISPWKKISHQAYFGKT